MPKRVKVDGKRQTVYSTRECALRLARTRTNKLRRQLAKGDDTNIYDQLVLIGCTLCDLTTALEEIEKGHK